MNKNLDYFDILPWNKNFNTGIEKIDEQHKMLVKLLNKLASCLIEIDTDVLNATFDELAKYATMHFDDEEAYWAEYFPNDYWLESHQMGHASFLPAVIKLKEENLNGLSETTEQIVKFLIRWLAFHIIDSDMRMSYAIKAIQSGATLEEAKVIADKKMSGSMRILIETILDMYDDLSSRAFDLMRERYARIRAEKELQDVNQKLQDALDEVNTLKGIIPICSYCKKIRDEKGLWDKVEAYLSKNSNAIFSHGICPCCLEIERKSLHSKKS